LGVGKGEIDVGMSPHSAGRANHARRRGVLVSMLDRHGHFPFKYTCNHLVPYNHITI